MSVTGPPPEMAESREDLTPMMSQYFELCESYDDALVLFQVGDFYEAFCDAAEEVSRVCEVTLTQREDSTGTYRMAGVPIDNAATYVESLLGAGHRVAVADQVQDPDEASGVVDRAVTRVVTPGTVTDDELLEAGTANYVACVAAGPGAEVGDGSSRGSGEDVDGVPDDVDAKEADGVPEDRDAIPEHPEDIPENPEGVPDDALDPGAYAVAFVDVATGEFLVADADRPATVADELERFAPEEVVTDPRLGRLEEAGVDVEFDPTVRVGAHDPEVFAPGRAAASVEDHVGRPGALVETVAGLRACGALLAYAEYTQGGADGELGHVSRLRCYEPDEYVHLNATALRSLEVFESRSEGEGPTLRDVLDRTSSALGRRRLTAWLRQPLLDRTAIERRHGAVADLVERSLARADLREALAEVYDLERLITRVTRGRADARDLRSLESTLSVVPEVRAALADDESDAAGLLEDLHGSMDELEDVRDLVDRAIRADPPAEITDGGVIREGYDDELDELRATEREGREWVADLEARERERTGIDSLAVGYNDVHGYYIEVTDPNLDRVPDDYTRRQTLKNSERFYTPELKRREDEILGAAERGDAREHRLFREVREEVAGEADRVESLADALATVDALTALATVAVERDYVRPEMAPAVGTDTSDAAGDTAQDTDAPDEAGTEGILIEGGRHPVVETTEETFVPNGADLTDERFAVITGPNMSGKSTYMRQVALTSLLAQAGSFVPADRARLPVVDGIYTRVGASDDIAGGQSTFMREMAELTEILHSATAESLVLLDEVGRGTSTVDGLSIAWAVTEYLHDRVGATTLFATHYHELTAIADDLSGVVRLHFGAERTGDDVRFRYDVREGAASSSYGVEIARMAGVPDPVVERSRSLVEAGGPAGTPDADDPADHPSVSSPQTDTSDTEVADGAPVASESGGPTPSEGSTAVGSTGASEGGTTGDRSTAGGESGTTGAGATEASESGSTGGETAATERPRAGSGESGPPVGRAERADADVEADLAADLLDVDVATMTPLEALNTLADLRSRAETYARDRTER